VNVVTKKEIYKNFLVTDPLLGSSFENYEKQVANRGDLSTSQDVQALALCYIRVLAFFLHINDDIVMQSKLDAKQGKDFITITATG
jgi:hypothetical protein